MLHLFLRFVSVIFSFSIIYHKQNLSKLTQKMLKATPNKQSYSTIHHTKYTPNPPNNQPRLNLKNPQTNFKSQRFFTQPIKNTQVKPTQPIKNTQVKPTQLTQTLPISKNPKKQPTSKSFIPPRQSQPPRLPLHSHLFGPGD